MIRSLYMLLVAAFMVLAPVGCATAEAGYWSDASGGGASAVDARQYGIQLDWTDANTVEIQEGQRLADDGSTFTVGSPIAVNWSDIDTGAEASSTGYYVWLTGDASAVLSLSATAPTGVAGGKYLAGWVYNDSGSDLEAFTSSVEGDHLDVWWLALLNHQVVNVTHPVPTTLTEVNASTGGHAPASNTAAVLLTGYTFGAASSMRVAPTSTGDTFFWTTGTTASASFSDVSIPTAGPSFWYLRQTTTSGDGVDIFVSGFRLDRSGI